MLNLAPVVRYTVEEAKERKSNRQSVTAKARLSAWRTPRTFSVSSDSTMRSLVDVVPHLEIIGPKILRACRGTRSRSHPSPPAG